MLSTIILSLFLFLIPAMFLFSRLFGPPGRPILRSGGDGASQNPQTLLQQSSPGQDTTPAPPRQPAPAAHQPTAMDVVVVKAMLQKALDLPLEVVLQVLDHAEYWPHTTVVMGDPFTVHSGRLRENHFLLRSRPLGLIRPTRGDQNDYHFTQVQALAPSSDSEYPLSQFQRWIGGPTGTLQRPCRKIVFTIHSHDQGWGGNREAMGTYNDSWTWFEAGLERFDKNANAASECKESSEKHVAPPSPTPASGSGTKPESSKPAQSDPDLSVDRLRSVRPPIGDDGDFNFPLLPSPEWTIQLNKTAVKQTAVHRVEWSWRDHSQLSSEELGQMGRGQATGTGEFVRNLKLGDVVTVWAKARFPGWANVIERVRMDVYWAL